MREITPNEVSKLYDCIRELSDYHNTTSVNFKGFYPLNPYEKTLEDELTFGVECNIDKNYRTVIL